LSVCTYFSCCGLLTINERAANKKLCESQNTHTARYALHEGTEKADDEEEGDSVDSDGDGNSSTQAKPNGVHTNPRSVLVLECIFFLCVCVCVYVHVGGLLGANKNNNNYSCVSSVYDRGCGEGSAQWYTINNCLL